MASPPVKLVQVDFAVTLLLMDFEMYFIGTSVHYYLLVDLFIYFKIKFVVFLNSRNINSIFYKILSLKRPLLTTF